MRTIILLITMCIGLSALSGCGQPTQKDAQHVLLHRHETGRPELCLVSKSDVSCRFVQPPLFDRMVGFSDEVLGILNATDECNILISSHFKSIICKGGGGFGPMKRLMEEFRGNEDVVWSLEGLLPLSDTVIFKIHFNTQYEEHGCFKLGQHHAILDENERFAEFSRATKRFSARICHRVWLLDPDLETFSMRVWD